MILNFFDVECTGVPDKEPFLSAPNLGPEITEYCVASWNDGLTTEVESKLIVPQNWRDTCEVDAEGIVRTLDGFPLTFREDEWRRAGACHWNKTDDYTMHRRLNNGAMMCGSNPAFDIARVNFELARSGHKLLPYIRRVDTSSLGVWLYFQGMVEGTGLERLAAHFGIEHEAHTANGDVLAAIAVFEKFVDQQYYHPKLWREALEVIVEASPDPDMGEYAAKALRGEEP